MIDYDFKVGDKVYWNDPGEGASSGLYTIAKIHNDDEPIEDDTIILITNAAGGEAEVMPTEICKDGLLYEVQDAFLIIAEDALYIRTSRDGKGEDEIVSWTVDEVNDEPELAFTIANAVAFLFKHGAEVFAESIGKEILSDGSVRMLSGYECANCGLENDHPTSECPQPDESTEE